MGGREPLRYPKKWFRGRMKDEQVRRLVLPLKYDSFYSLFGTFVAGSDRLREFSADSALNTDDRPVVVFQAPRVVYGDPSPAEVRLLALIDRLSPPDPEAILIPYITEEDYLARNRLSAYWQARDTFLRSGADIERTGNVRQMHDAVRESLLEVVRQSGDFSSAYFPLLSIAYEMFPLDREALYQLLSDLMRANPMRHEAFVLRNRLFEEHPAGWMPEM